MSLPTDDSGNDTSVNISRPLTDKFSSGFEQWGDFLFGSVMIFIGVASLAGNGLAVRVFLRKGREITIPEILLLNIAVVDLFLAGVSYPAAIVAAFSHRWIFGGIGCTLYGATCYFLGLATIFSLTILAVFRFIKACYPDKCQWLTVSKAPLCLILPVYLYSLLWTILPLVGWGGYDIEPFGLSCTLAWRNPDYGGKVYVMCASIFCVIMPTIVIVISHWGILRQIRRAGQMFLDKSVGKQCDKAEIQFIRVSVAVCSGFLIAWAPYAIISIWSAFGDSSSIPLWLTPIPVVLAKSSIAYNPIIYVLMTRRYRDEFTRALRELLHLPERVTDSSAKQRSHRRTRPHEQEATTKPMVLECTVQSARPVEDDGESEEVVVTNIGRNQKL